MATSTPARAGHKARVMRTPSGSRQPWRADCSCGWQSRTYAADHAAQIMADAHEAGQD